MPQLPVIHDIEFRFFIRLLGSLIVGLSLFVPEPLFAAGSDSREASKWFGRSFDATSVKILAAGFAASGVARPGDDGVRDAWVGHQRMDKDVAHVGDLLGTGVPGLLIGLTQYQFDRVNGEAHLKAWAATGIWTYALKTAVARKRPGTSENRQSWPSGHTSTSFATATSLAYAYGWKAGVPSYMVATGVALSRLADDAHWLSDTIAGATVGIWMGYAYASFTEISPNDRPDSADIGGVIPASMSQIRWVPSFGNETLFLNLLSDF